MMYDITQLPRSRTHTHTHTQALDGFLLVLDKEGTILFASESITTVVGLTQVQRHK